MPPQQPEAFKVAVPDVSVIRSESSVLVAEAKEIRVTSHEEYQKAGAFVQRCARLHKSVLELFEGPTKDADKVHKFLTGLRGQLVAVPDQARAIAEVPMKRFLEEDARRRREEEARIQADLRKREEDRMLAEAQVLSDAGDKAAAERLIEQPVMAPVVELAKPEAAGVSMRRKWGWRITDEGKINREFLLADEKKIRATVAALGPDAATLVGGIEVFEDQVVAVRT